MVIIPQLKHNQLEQVDVPRASELYKKLGFGTPEGKYSGDEAMSPNESKIDQVSMVSKEAFEPSKDE